MSTDDLDALTVLRRASSLSLTCFYFLLIRVLVVSSLVFSRIAAQLEQAMAMFDRINRANEERTVRLGAYCAVLPFLLFGLVVRDRKACQVNTRESRITEKPVII